MRKLVLLLVILSVASCGAKSDDVLIVVPRLTNLNLETANKIAAEYEINLEVIEERDSENVPSNSVISQIPNPGEMVKSSRSVSIILSKGRGKMPMPKLTGLSFYSAYKSIQKHNLKLGSIEEVESTRNIVGTVEDQFPAQGTMVGRDTPVNLVISNGSFMVMPDLVGLSLDDAVALIGGMGFNAGRMREIKVVDPVAYSNSASGYVVRQDPEPGMQVDSQNPIDIYYKP